MLNKVMNWKRALIGGLISALAAGVCFGVFLFNSRLISGSVIAFILLGFAFPGLLIRYSGNTVIFFTVIAFWFLAGVSMGWFVKRNMIAIGAWFLLYILSLIFSVAIFAEINR
jgi:hypothetical protein